MRYIDVFPGTIRSDESEDLTFLNGEADILQGFYLAIVFRYVVYLYCIHRHVQRLELYFTIHSNLNITVIDELYLDSIDQIGAFIIGDNGLRGEL